MKLTYTLTLDDYKAAEKLHISQRLGRRIGYWLMYVGIPILAVLGLIGFYAFNIGATSDLSLGYSIIEVILISQAIFIPIERSKRLSRPLRAKTSKGEVGAVRLLEIDDDKILSGIPDVAKTELAWDAIVTSVHNENVAMLYLNDKDFILIPIRAFTPSERTGFLGFVARHVEKRRSC
jgi:hypothetical protein